MIAMMRLPSLGSPIIVWVMALGRFLAAFALCALVATVTRMTMTGFDGWYLNGFPETVQGYVLENLWEPYGTELAIGSLSAALVLAPITTLLVLAKREGLASYLALCALLPFALLLSLNGEHEVVQLSVSGVAVAACWWFAYRRQRARGHRHVKPPLAFWLVLAVACIPLGIIMRNNYRLMDAQNRPKSAAERNSLLPSWIHGGVVAQGQLWMFNEGGRLATYSLKSQQRRLRAPHGIIGVKAQGETVSALTLGAENPADRGILVDRWEDDRRGGRFFVQTFHDGRTLASAKVKFAGDDWPVALAVDDQRTFVLTRRLLYVRRANEVSWEKVTLSAPLFDKGSGVSVIAEPSVGRDRNVIHAGVDNRTYGGGRLIEISTDTGQVTTILRDDVLAIEPHGQTPDCIMASVGGSHLWFGHGRLIEVCGRRVRTVLERPIVTPSSFAARLLRQRFKGKNPSRQNTEIFHNLVQLNNSDTLAGSSLGLYRRTGDQSWQRQSIPAFVPMDGIWVSHAIPGVILVSGSRLAQYGATDDYFAIPVR